jgi:hypothetical protein
MMNREAVDNIVHYSLIWMSNIAHSLGKHASRLNGDQTRKSSMCCELSMHKMEETA